ncbi:MAG: tetratricopeptide repeat protein [Sphingomicrobium sp.]
MAWLILLLLGAAALGGLHLLGVRGAALAASAAALLIGASGYALQGRPNLPGASAEKIETGAPIPLAEARHAFFERFTAAESWLVIAEALERRGRTEDAAGLLQNAIRRRPGDAQLWVGLGNALVAHSDGLTPPAEFAYRRAAALNPAHPAPLFFYGLARARSGDPATARLIWLQLLDAAPADAKWRPLVEAGVAALDPNAPQAASGK